MCVARKSGPGREYSIAVDWRDCAWSPRIVVRRSVAAQLDPATRVGRCCRAAQTSTRALLFSPAGGKTITRRNRINFLNP
jgi:hypothetical protein